jgi:hypothetical protein
MVNVTDKNIYHKRVDFITIILRENFETFENMVVENDKKLNLRKIEKLSNNCRDSLLLYLENNIIDKGNVKIDYAMQNQYGIIVDEDKFIVIKKHKKIEQQNKFMPENEKRIRSQMIRDGIIPYS